MAASAFIYGINCVNLPKSFPYVSKRELTAEERQSSFTEMMLLALETAVSSSVTKVAEISAPGTGGRSIKYMEKGRVVIQKDGKRYNAEGILIEE